MRPAVRIAGIGIAHASRSGPEDSAARVRKLQAALPQAGSAGRLFHPIEEVTLLAAHEALGRGGVSAPVSGEGIGIALGIEEGIDGIKARYYEAVLRDGPLGASPMAFPLTTPNTIAARVSILLDLRGESFTVCGGGIAGAHAVGLAVQAVRDGRSGAMLAGGTTAVEREFLDALRHAGRSAPGDPACGACVLLLAPDTPDGRARRTGCLLGSAEGFGKEDLLDAIRGCLEDAVMRPEEIASVRMASVDNGPAATDAVRRAGVAAPIVRSPAAGLYAASFPLAVAEAVAQAGASVLIIGSDCLAGAAAAVVRGES